jgi:hypothetical protein
MAAIHVSPPVIPIALRLWFKRSECTSRGKSTDRRPEWSSLTLTPTRTRESPLACDKGHDLRAPCRRSLSRGQSTLPYLLLLVQATPHFVAFFVPRVVVYVSSQDFVETALSSFQFSAFPFSISVFSISAFSFSLSLSLLPLLRLIGYTPQTLTCADAVRFWIYAQRTMQPAGHKGVVACCFWIETHVPRGRSLP